MKIAIRKTAGMVGTALVLALALGLSSSVALAVGTPPGIDPDDHGKCTVRVSHWHNEIGADGISLRSAVYMANNYDEWKACDKSITLEKDVAVGSPLVIAKSGLVLDGGGHTLDLTKMSGTSTDGQSGKVQVVDKAGATSEVTCAVVLLGNDIMLKNLKLSGMISSDNVGICVMGSGNKIGGVESTGGKTGFVLGQNSSSNMLLPNNKVLSAKEFGIADYTKGSNLNIVVMSNVVPVTDSKGEKTDQDGMIDTSAGEFYSIEQMLEETFKFTDDSEGSALSNMVLAGEKGLFFSRRTVVPLVTSIEQIGNTDRYHIKGIFKNPTSLEEQEDGGFAPIDCGGVTDKSVARMGVFMIEGTNRAYVGTVGKNSAKGVDPEKGDFDFYIDASKNPTLAGGSFVLVPVDQNWQLIGRAGNYKSLAGNQTDCVAGTEPDGTGSNGNGNGGGSGLIGYDSVLACNLDLEFQSGNLDTSKDSDLDGVPDFLEMAIRKNSAGTYVYDPISANCDCDSSPVLSCWYKPDSDNDGILDGKDNYLQGLDYNALSSASAVTNLSSQPPDSDTDALADVKSTDSDSDGLMDGQEDRMRLYNRNAPSYFMYLGTIGDPFYRDSHGNKVECDLNNFGADAINNGIGFSLFKAGGVVGSTYLDEPVQYNMFTPPQLQDGQGIFPMACINKSVSSDKDFNGVYDSGRGETNARTPDTDGDCVCDGHGTGCAKIDSMTAKPPMSGVCQDNHGGVSVINNPQWLDDGCPEKQAETKICTAECIEHEVLGYVRDNYPEWVEDPDAQTVVLKDDNDNSIPDLFEQKGDETTETVFGKEYTWKEPVDWKLVQTVCSDVDKDNIPDCVERWEDTCTPTAAQKAFLNPYSKDSDADGAVDGMAQGSDKEDVCPFTPAKATGADFLTLNNPNYSCDARQVYQGSVPKILSCFLDRDADGLRDCLEDRDMNGQLKSPAVGVAGIYESESDPLIVDTDADGEEDYAEVVGWPYRTNPALADTDADGLVDKDEDRDGDGVITLSDDRSSQGCGPAEMKLDTDPRNADTDGDVLTDGMEIKGPIVDTSIFLGLIEDSTVWGQGGIPHGSNANAKDADGDGLPDGWEYNGSAISYYDSNPCMMDSDGDAVNDDDEFVGCALNKDPNCAGTGEKNSAASVNHSTKDTSGGIDSDSDGLSDMVEGMLGSDPNNQDTDGDGVRDGDEDINHNGIYEANLGETNALVADTDGDALNDGMELRYGTDPTNIDTDGDCISDGIEDMNHNGTFDMGTETNGLSFDTDGDKLPDGWVASSGLGEDLNCNGIREQDAQGLYTETDPRNPDSDLDGTSDYEEMTNGGYFNISNMERATVGHEGCSLIGTTAGAPTSMFYLLGLLMAATKAMARRKKEKTPA